MYLNPVLNAQDGWQMMKLEPSELRALSMCPVVVTMSALATAQKTQHVLNFQT